MSKISFPAVIVLSAIRRYNGSGAQVVAFADGLILLGLQDLDNRLMTYRLLEERGGAPYIYTLAEVTKTDEVIDTQRRALEFEAGLRISPDPDPLTWEQAIDKAVELARAYFEDLQDAAALARLPRGIALANGQNWTEEPDGWTFPGSEGRTYKVNGTCTCPDATIRGVHWCKHRIARCLARRARELQKDGAESAVNTSAPEQVSEETFTQKEYTIIGDDEQEESWAEWRAEQADQWLTQRGG